MKEGGLKLEMKVLFENFRKFVNEEEQAEMGARLDTEYPQFVQWLGSNIKDAKTQALIGAGLKDGDDDEDKFTFKENTPILVSKLKPTQDEIDIDKSLAFPLVKTGGEKFIEYVSSDGPFKLGAPIVTFMGKYVIDGHHRWSQLYACNKNASIVAVDVSIQGVEPLDALKAVQMAIGLQAKKIPMQSVKGTNLLKISKSQLGGWIKKNVPAETYNAIATNDAVKNLLIKGLAINEANQMEMKMIQGALIKFIGSNVASMRKTSQPVPGAGPRDYMPQTDNIPWRKPLEVGKIDIKPPHASRKAAE
jgi:hypothetical protein